MFDSRSSLEVYLMVNMRNVLYSVFANRFRPRHIIWYKGVEACLKKVPTLTGIKTLLRIQ